MNDEPTRPVSEDLRELTDAVQALFVALERAVRENVAPLVAALHDALDPVFEEQAKRERHKPPMWAIDPTKSRRRK